MLCSIAGRTLSRRGGLRLCRRCDEGEQAGGLGGDHFRTGARSRAGGRPRGTQTPVRASSATAWRGRGEGSAGDLPTGCPAGWTGDMPPRAGRRGNGRSGSRRRPWRPISARASARVWGRGLRLLGGESAGLGSPTVRALEMGAGPSTRGLTAVMEHPLLRCRSPDRGKHTQAQRATANLGDFQRIRFVIILSDPSSACGRRLRSGRAGCRIFVESCGTRRGTAHSHRRMPVGPGERIISAPVELMSWGSPARTTSGRHNARLCRAFERADSRRRVARMVEPGWAHWDPTGARTRAASRADGGA